MKDEVIKRIAYMQGKKKKDGLHPIPQISDIFPVMSHVGIIIDARWSSGMTGIMVSRLLFPGRASFLDISSPICYFQARTK